MKIKDKHVRSDIYTYIEIKTKLQLQSKADYKVVPTSPQCMASRVSYFG